ncbi:hypothetical protein [Aeromicrobium sp. UC242_57]|uniref:hypothetical protein n=1 Tax=Aeromicrobium sp. UC242_57 TaxID=3374624 RepID=UPI0037ACB6A4
MLRAAAERPARPDARTIVFRFAASPVQIVGQHAVEAVQYCDNDLVADGNSVRAVATDQLTTLHAGLVLRSIGYRGTPLPGLPFDETAAVVPNEQGRVAGRAGVYVVGWIKRGPSGFIGTRQAAPKRPSTTSWPTSTPGCCLHPADQHHSLRALVDSRAAHAVDVDAWRAIDDIERQDGRRTGRPRRKRVSLNDLLDATQHAPAERQGRRRFARR